MLKKIENLLIPAMMVAFCFLLEICNIGTATKNYFILTIISICIYIVVGLYEAVVMHANSKKAVKIKKEIERLEEKRNKGFDLSEKDLEILEEGEASLVAFQELESIFKKRGGWDILFTFVLSLALTWGFSWLLNLDFFTVYLILDFGSAMNDNSNGDSGFKFTNFDEYDDMDDEEYIDDEDEYDSIDDDDYDEFLDDDEDEDIDTEDEEDTDTDW